MTNLHLVKIRNFFIFAICAVLLSACASAPPKAISHDLPTAWVDSITEYEKSLSESQLKQIESLFKLDSEIINDVKTRFGHLDKSERAQALSRWLIGFEGRAMIYDLDANYTPNEAFHKAEANCLSFTMLVITLAKELGVELKYNVVDIPNIWASDDGSSMVLVRHINAIDVSSSEPRIYDLAMFNYELGYPQKAIQEQDAVALFYNNRGVDFLQSGNPSLALHNLKLAISKDATNSDLWNNLGVAYKRVDQISNAQRSFATALKIDSRNGVAASNLERIYRKSGNIELADHYALIAARARSKNPYVQFSLAREYFDNGEFHLAHRHINKAISLYQSDGRFYELRSYVRQAQLDYQAAYHDLQVAQKLSIKPDQQARYQNKVERMAQFLAANPDHSSLNRNGFNSDFIRSYRPEQTIPITY